MAKQCRWYFNIKKWTPKREEWLKLTASIADEELERINKYQFEEDSKASLVGRALMRKFVSQATKIPSNELVFTRTDRGRPEICKHYINRLEEGRWPAMLDFNVSHSGDYCVLAGIWSDEEHPETSVGIDVTQIVRKKTRQDLDRFLDLMSRRQFTRTEWDTVEQANGDRQKCINFTRLWCLKESFIKSTGTGIAFNLNRIDFQLDKNNKYSITTDQLKGHLIDTTKVHFDGSPAPDWKFLETAIDDEHIVSIGYNIKTSDHDLVDQVKKQLGKGDFVEIAIESLVDSLKPMHSEDEGNWTIFSRRLTKSL